MQYSLQVFRDSFSLVIVSPNGVGSCQDGGTSRQAAHNACLGYTDTLLLLGSKNKGQSSSLLCKSANFCSMENGSMGTRLSLGMRLGVLLPWLPAVLGADYPSCQIHRYSNNLQQRREREREVSSSLLITVTQTHRHNAGRRCTHTHIDTPYPPWSASTRAPASRA